MLMEGDGHFESVSCRLSRCLIIGFWHICVSFPLSFKYNATSSDSCRDCDKFLLGRVPSSFMYSW